MSSAFFMPKEAADLPPNLIANVELAQWASRALKYLNDYVVDLRENEDHDRACVIEDFIEELEGGT